MDNVYEKGSKIGYLTLVEKTGEKDKEKYSVWLCVCTCGETVKKSTSYMRTSKGKASCVKCAKERQRKAVTKHGLTVKHPRLFSVGKQAMSRCNNPKDKNFHNYGGRGIRFEFDSLENFVEWSLQNGYQDDYSIERVDVNGNYSPENCKWIPFEEQAKNKRTTPEFHGHKGLTAIAEYKGITNKALQAYIYKKKMTFEEVYELSKTDPTFRLSLYEKTSIKAKQRKEDWKLSKEDVEEILHQLKNGKTKSYLARKVYKVDLRTLEKAIKRYEEGLYN